MNTMQPDTYEERLLTALLDDHPGNTEAVGDERSGRRRTYARPKVAILAAAAVVVLLAGPVLVPGGGRGTAAAATPTPLAFSAPTDPAQILDELASIARSADGPATVDGWYQHRNEWHLTTAVSDDSTTSWVTPQVVEEWHTPDDGLRRLTRNGTPMDPSNTSPESEAEAIAALPTGSGTEMVLPPGEHADRSPLDTADAFRAELLALHPDRDPASVLWQGVAEYVTSGHVTPMQTAILLDVLAGIDGVEHRGLIVDRAGRAAHAITFESTDSGLDTRYALLLDPDTAQVFGYEAVLIGDPGALNVESPAVISYTTILESNEM